MRKFVLAGICLVAAPLAFLPQVVAQDAAADEAAQLADLMDAGEGLYQDNCAACHGPGGEGVVGPNLHGNEVVQSRSSLGAQILWGYPVHGMPPFAANLDDEEIAAIATFVRNSWGNDYGLVTAEQVARYRERGEAAG